MNRRIITNLVAGYLIGLVSAAIFYGLVHVLHRPYTGVPTGVLWGAAFTGAVMTLRVDWDRSQRLQTVLVLTATLTILGLVVIGIVSLAGVPWEHDATRPWIDVLLSSALLGALAYFQGPDTSPTSSGGQ